MTREQEKPASDTTRRVVDELIILRDKFAHNTATEEDYRSFESILEILGLSKDFLRDSLKENGFADWTNYVQARKKENINNAVGIGSVLGALHGIIKALIDFLNSSNQGRRNREFVAH